MDTIQDSRPTRKPLLFSTTAILLTAALHAPLLSAAGLTYSKCQLDTDGDNVGYGAINCVSSSFGVPSCGTGKTQLWTGTANLLTGSCPNDTSVPPENDNCPYLGNVSQVDSNANGVGDACEGDKDGDGVGDAVDNCPTVANSMQINTDGDSQGDLCDIDDDNDGIGDSGDNCPLDSVGSPANTDSNDLCNVNDPDDDNDGIADVFDTFPIDILKPGYSSLYTFYGSSDSQYGNFGRSVSAAGDVNGDGYGDVIIGDPGADTVNGTDSGNATVRSGADGSVLFTFKGDAATNNFGYAVSGAGDVNHDGRADVLVGAYTAGATQAGMAKIFSGADGSVLLALNGDSAGDNFGFSVASAGDVNSDGYQDLVVGAPNDDNNGTDSGSASVFSGANGSLLFTVNGDAASDYFGYSVNGAGDINSDGHADIIVGAYNGGLARTGMAKIISGASGGVLFTLRGDSTGSYFGYSVSGAGDVNGDGRSDVVVGAYKTDVHGRAGGGAYVFSGANGSVLYAFDGDYNDQLGYSVAGAGDVNVDGYADVLVGAPAAVNNGTSSGLARLFSGFNGAILYNYNGDAAVNAFGKSVSAAGDLNGDGVPDLLVGMPSASAGGNYGGARIISGTVLRAWTDSDFDGVVDSNDTYPHDTDNDGIPNSTDVDDDGDGVPDYIDANPLNPSVTGEKSLPLNGLYKGGMVRELQYR